MNSGHWLDLLLTPKTLPGQTEGLVVRKALKDRPARPIDAEPKSWYPAAIMHFEASHQY